MPHSKRTATGVLGGLLGLVGLSAVAGLLITATVTPAIAVSGYAASSAISMFDNMPSYLQPEKLMMPTEIYKKASDGSDVLMAEFYDQNRIPVTYEEVAPVMYDAILSSEDKNFYTHGGVDLVGTVKALVGNASSGSNRGGSSITQQYVKNVLQQNCEVTAKSQEEVQDCYRETTVSSGVEGYERKLQEMRYAIQLEQEVSKDDILLGYLNIAAFGGTTYGIGAAAERYFGVAAKDLSIAQAAAIAGMVQEPNTLRIDLGDAGTTTDSAGTPVNTNADGFKLTTDRRNYVLGRMLADNKITQAEYDEAVATPVTPNVVTRPVGCSQAVGAEFFCDYVRSLIVTDTAFGATEDDRINALRRGGLKVYTTLDSDLQAAAVEAISVVPANVDYMNLGSSGIQIEVGTGRVLSMVQNRAYDPAATEENAPTTAVNYNVRAQNGGGGGHSAGSTYKVFSLLNWLEQGHSVNEVINGRVGPKKIDQCDGTIQNVVAGNGPSPQVGNFERNPGYSGTPFNFTRDSLNSGFLAMAEKISVCSTNRLAMKMGVTMGNGEALDQTNLAYNVLGDQPVAPIDMAAAYAAIAANGMLCQPKAIDRVIDRDGAEFTPERTCERVMSEGVAATAADTLVSVMSGTGVGARIGDGVPVFGKTGIHQYLHTWMDGASTKVATVVWVGNVKGEALLNEHRENGWQLSRIRNSIWPAMQGAANSKYGGDRFPEPSAELTKRVLTDLPSVIGQSTEEATQTLQAAGFSVNVADAADGVEAAGTIIAQDPGAGRAPGGATVTITPSNGSGVSVPAVSGAPDQAQQQLRAAGFSSLSAECSQSESAPDQGVVTGTNPAAGTVVNRSASITIQYQAKNCSPGGGGRGNG